MRTQLRRVEEKTCMSGGEQARFCLADSRDRACGGVNVKIRARRSRVAETCQAEVRTGDCRLTRSLTNYQRNSLNASGKNNVSRALIALAHA